MPKYKAKNKDAKLSVKVNLLRSEILLERELSLISQTKFRGMLRPVVLRKNLLIYSGPQAIPLCEYLRRTLTSYEFHYILSQIVCIERNLSANGLRVNNLIKDFRYTYINPYTNELSFIYLPLSSGASSVSILEFMEAVSSVWKSNPCEEDHYISEFLGFLKRNRNYQPLKYITYFKQHNSRVADLLRRTHISASGFITDKKADYYKHYADRALLTDILPENEDGTALLDELDTDLLAEPDTALLEEPETVLLDEPGTALLDEPDTELLGESGTALLDEGENTMPLFEPVSFYPYFIRCSTNERIVIDKPVFRIGKERSYVDCFISNNNAISRSHADIITRGTRYYICDRNSTNKTYRNGCILTPEDEVEIFDGDLIQLANENFEFHTA